ncbi:MAG: hypothetical protein KJZ86_19720 [Caldilineaceae bacterium]|mgnify:CR=1 FL=1|nr:hypothetical protein [Caldilineaceae bacterium]HRJ41489.1 hypothetical protein [Caldilineaceae bacterium]
MARLAAQAYVIAGFNLWLSGSSTLTFSPAQITDTLLAMARMEEYRLAQRATPSTRERTDVTADFPQGGKG